MAENDLNALLLAAEQLTSDINVDDELPKTNRTLKQLADSSNKLFSKLSSIGPQDVDANLLLSSKGVDLTHLTRKVENIASQKISVPLDPFPVTDIKSYLYSEKKNAIFSIIEDIHQKFDNILEESIDAELEREVAKRRDNLLNNLDQLTALRDDTPLIHREVIQDNPLLILSSPLNQNQILYASALVEYNQAVIEGKRSNLMEKIMAFVSSSTDQKMKDVWKLVSSIDLSIVTGGDVLVKRSEPSQIEELISKARSYLEKRFVEYIESIISKNTIQMQRGGVPGIYSMILAYVKARINPEYDGVERITVDGAPFWPVCYYCIRCGDIDAALQAVVRTGSDLYELTKALNMLKDSQELRLPYDLAKMFKFSIRNSSDPFKRTLYCLLGMYNFNNKREEEEMIKTAEDYLWFQLCVVAMPNQQTFVKDMPDVHLLSYESLQNDISQEYGESGDQNADNPFLSFQMLFLTGQFEAAIDVIYRTDKYYVHAVHVAIVLAELGCLALSDRITRPLISAIDDVDRKPMKRLNLATLIKMYIQLFQEKDVEIALHYCFCLRNMHIEDSCVFPNFIVELVLQTQQYDCVFGHILEDGCRVPGFIDKFHGSKTIINEIIAETANALIETGNIFYAVKLYHLCDDYENLLKITNSTISTMLTNPANDPFGVDVVDYVEKIMRKNIGSTCFASENTVKTFNTLVELLSFFKFYNAKQYSKALDLIQNLNLIPLNQENIQAKAEQFRYVDPLVLKTISDVLITVMKMLVENFKEIRSSLQVQDHDKSLESNLQDLRESAETLISFAGKIPYQLPADTSSKLVLLKVCMI